MGNLGDLRVGYEALDAAAADILNSAVAMDNKLNDMESRMQSRMTEWSGSDQQAYLTAKGEWDTAMQEMMRVLQDIARAVNLSREEYAAAEAANARRFQ